MLTHYLKTAFQSLKKYKQQSVISVVGLSVGFVCFALAILWVRYENSFDKFHPGYERIFAVVFQDETAEKGFNTLTPYPLFRRMKEVFPEVEESCFTTTIWNTKYSFNGNPPIDIYPLRTDYNFFKVFGMSPAHKKVEDVLAGRKSVIVTDKGAELVNPGGALNAGDAITYKSGSQESDSTAFVEEVIKGWPKNTNFHFDVIFPLTEIYDDWFSFYLYTFVKVREGVDMQAFKEKVEAYELNEGSSYKHIRLIPVSEWYRTVGSSGKNVKYEYILLFSFAGLLVVFCALFNYLSLFISRLRMRGKELVLRKVNGASNGELLKQLLTEFLLMLLISVLLGFLIIEFVYSPFQKLAFIQLSRFSVFSELSAYVLVLVLVSALISLYPILYFRKRTFQSELGAEAVRSRNVFSRVSIWVQFVVGIFFLFCSIVMMRQINHLTQVDLGFDRQNIVQININTSDDNKVALIDELKKIPTIKQVSGMRAPSLFLPTFGSGGRKVTTEDGKEVFIEVKRINAEIMEMLNFRILKGEMVEPGKQQVLLNESAVKLIGNADVSRSLGEVKGVVQDFLYESPLVKARPVMLSYERPEGQIWMIMLKYQEGTRAQTEKAISALEKGTFSGMDMKLFNMEDEYDKFLNAERAMILLLGILSAVCVIVALFGIYSMVSLTCERRRKEIAIRKVNGASIWSLLMLFIKEYFYSLLLASAVAFLIGYKVMQLWIESYINQIQIGTAIYFVIFITVALLVGAIILYRVWRNIHANPSEELKRE